MHTQKGHHILQSWTLHSLGNTPEDGLGPAWPQLGDIFTVSQGAGWRTGVRPGSPVSLSSVITYIGGHTWGGSGCHDGDHFTGLIVNIDIAVRSAALQQWLDLQIGNSRQRDGGTINSSHILILTSIKTLGILNRQIIQFSKQLLANQTYFFIPRLSVC